MRRRLLITFLALGAGLIGADQILGRVLIQGGRYRGRFLPPFGTLERPEVDQVVRRHLRWLRGGQPTAKVRNVWDRELGWTNQPGVAEERGNTVSVNSLGARSVVEYPPRPADGVLRLVCYGDSFTFCTEVGDGGTWPRRIETTYRDVEAINMGVGAYGIDQALLRFRRRGLFGAEVCVVGFALQGVARTVNRYYAFWQPSDTVPKVKPRFLLRGGGLELLPQPYATQLDFLLAVQDGSARRELAEHDHWAGDDPLVPGSGFARALAGRRAHRRRAACGWNEGCEGPALTLEILDTFRREALEAGAERFLLLIFPFRGDLTKLRWSGEGPAYWDGFVDELDRRGVESIDLARALMSFDDEEPLHLKTHFSGRANQLVAERVGAWLAERGHRLEGR